MKYTCVRTNKNKILTYSGIVFLALFLTACGSSNNTQTPPNSKELSGKLLPPEGNEIYFGAFTEFGHLEDNVTTQVITNFDRLAQKNTAWSYFSNNWTTINQSNNHSPEIRYPRESIRKIHNLGKTPFVRLLPWTSPHIIENFSEVTRKSSANNLLPICKASSNLPHNETTLVSFSEYQEFINNGATDGPCFNDFSMQSIIDGDWDDKLIQWAQDSKNNLDKDGDPIPLLATFTIEMNGYWFPWSGIYNGGTKNEYESGDELSKTSASGKADGPERFRNAYRHIIDLFREQEVNHITWFFVPDTIGPNRNYVSLLTEEWNKQTNYYPGDDYIDWIGTNLYGAARKNATWKDFNTELELKYQEIADITPNKPIALLEFGVVEDHVSGNKSDWLQQTFETILAGDYLNFKAISYWNDGWEGADMRIDSSEETLTTFRELINNERFISELRFSE